MKHLWTCTACMLLSLSSATAQSIGPSTYNTTGGSNSAGPNTIEYAIGGVVAGNTYIASNLVVTQGVLQPKIAAPSNVETPTIAAADLFLFPNPAAQTLYLQPRFKKGGLLEYMLMDASGRMLRWKSVKLEQGNERQEISMGDFASGQYNLRVQWTQQGKTSSNVFKVQKIK